ncbi:hypothetical protein [Allostreptomyces psammosilenae]|uniref:Uncharacterized protein n=1 Tax=Allostreptomyces psammosilenae TaxID=1892865 RepID=A0A853A5G9_9ACTN|nr:hypothetical protein [Allostreptomyces psammosilenae]NYI05768.1 hypothetical protein [Allostreptomyces psammosilenae]
MPEGFESRPQSLNGNASVLLELAGLLQAGRPEPDLITMAATPASHADVGDKVRRFSDFACDQYQDAVALLLSLSTKLRATAAGHVQVDEGVAGSMDALLRGRLVPPGDRAGDNDNDEGY